MGTPLASISKDSNGGAKTSKKRKRPLKNISKPKQSFQKPFKFGNKTPKKIFETIVKPKQNDSKAIEIEFEDVSNHYPSTENENKGRNLQDLDFDGLIGEQQFKQLKDEIESVIAAKKRSYYRPDDRSLDNRLNSLIEQLGRAGYDFIFTNDEETTFKITKH